MKGKVRRMAGKHKRARTALRLAHLILVAKGALLDVEPEQIGEELGG